MFQSKKRRSAILVIFRLSTFLIALLCGATAFGEGNREAAPSAVTPTGAPVVRAFVSILPQVYFVRTIGGSRVSVQSMVPPGVEPETYDPTPRQMTQLSQAKVFFAVGLPFEATLIPKIRSSMKSVLVVDTQANVPTRTFSQHTTGSTAGEAGTDPHIWLSPQLVKMQGATIEKALAKIDPAGAADYAAGLAKLDSEMDALHAEISSSLSGLNGRSFFVFHPAFGYFADEFGLKQVSIEVEGKSPGPQQLASLIDEAKKLKVRMIFVEPEFDQSRAKVIADTVGAKVVVIDPLAEDYVANLTEVAKQIKAAIE